MKNIDKSNENKSTSESHEEKAFENTKRISEVTDSIDEVVIDINNEDLVGEDPDGENFFLD